VALTRTDALVAAAEAALDRMVIEERTGSPPNIFAPLGESLFWIIALAEAKGQKQLPLILGLTWARNRIAHGVLVTAPVNREGPGLPRKLPFALLSSYHAWLGRNQIRLSENDRPAPRQEAAYDSEIAGKQVVLSFQSALTILR
jgi:hypothetical protein